jgi:hypothetical protein
MSKAFIPADGDSGLYLAHQKIYPREVRGQFQNLRTACVYLLLGLYYCVLWLQWDGRQAVLFDLPARKFYIFGLIFWPQDFFYLAWLLIMAGLNSAGRACLVRLCLSANGVDRGFPLDGTVD